MDISDPDGGSPAASPAINLFVRGRSAAKQLACIPPSVAADPALSCRPVDTLAQYSADGELLGCIEGDGVVRVMRASGGAQVFSVQRPSVQALQLSPRGTFLLTWERISEGMDASAQNGNLRIWRVATGECVCSWLQKVLGEKSMWPAIAWSVDEQIAYRLVTNEVHFFDGAAPTQAPAHKLRIEGVAQCSLEPTAGPHHVATFVPENKGAPAVLRLWRHPDFGEGRFMASKSFFKASEAQMHWSPKGGALLIHTHTEFDKSNASYYGNTALYLMGRLDSGKARPRSRSP
jgi:translation initiation factor 2A